MAKPVKKIKVKKPIQPNNVLTFKPKQPKQPKKVRQPRQPRQPRRQGVPRKPPVTNISVTIAGGSNQPSGSYYFPDAAQQVQPLVSNIFTPAPMQSFRPRIEEPPVRDIVEMGTQTAAPKLRVVADVGLQTQGDIVEMGTQTQEEPLPLSAARRGRPLATEIRAYNPNNKTLAQVQDAALTLGIPVVNAAGKKLTKKQLAKMINLER